MKFLFFIPMYNRIGSNFIISFAQLSGQFHIQDSAVRPSGNRDVMLNFSFAQSDGRPSPYTQRSRTTIIIALSRRVARFVRHPVSFVYC